MEPYMDFDNEELVFPPVAGMFTISTPGQEFKSELDTKARATANDDFWAVTLPLSSGRDSRDAFSFAASYALQNHLATE